LFTVCLPFGQPKKLNERVNGIYRLKTVNKLNGWSLKAQPPDQHAFVDCLVGKPNLAADMNS
jgi:hypothetical protein